MIRPSRTLFAALALTGALGLAACGDTGDDEAGSDDTAAPADTAEGTTEGGSSEAVDCEASPGETVTVDIPEFMFDPDPVTVGVCDSVVWSNSHSQAHTSTGQGDKTWSTGNIQAGEMSEPVLFDAAGELTYICALHPFMKGTVEVS
ncbi:MAG: hypothetical protein Q8K58_12200 [Acidimicrobiales bacterium]|nr:hypothetical protein [Acidimicrobiales bacterium]